MEVLLFRLWLFLEGSFYILLMKRVRYILLDYSLSSIIKLLYIFLDGVRFFADVWDIKISQLYGFGLYF